MKTYGPKGLIIFQACESGFKQTEAPTLDGLDTWIATYKPAGASGIDPEGHSSKYLFSGVISSLPFNMILDAKTLEILEKNVKAADLEAKIQQHLK